MTFKTCKDVDEITRYFEGKDKKHHMIFGDTVHIKRAPEPSDIIWENYGINYSRHMSRKILAILTLIILSLVVYAVIFYFIIAGTDF